MCWKILWKYMALFQIPSAITEGNNVAYAISHHKKSGLCAMNEYTLIHIAPCVQAEFTSLKEQEDLPTKTMENLHDSITAQVNSLVQLNDS